MAIKLASWLLLSGELGGRGGGVSKLVKRNFTTPSVDLIFWDYVISGGFISRNAFRSI